MFWNVGFVVNLANSLEKISFTKHARDVNREILKALSFINDLQSFRVSGVSGVVFGMDQVC